VEVVKGTSGNDRMVGNDGPNRFEGSAGMDEIFGRGGDDVLWGDTDQDKVYGEGGNDDLRGGDNGDLIDGGPGSDLFIGDPPCTFFYCAGGNDEIQARDGVGESIDCGVGADIAVVDQHDVTSDCESVDRQTVAPGGGAVGGGRVDVSFAVSRQRLLTALRRGLKVTVSCRQPCRTRGEFLVSSGLLARSVRVARGSKTLRRAGRATLVLKFTRKAKRKLRRYRRVKGTVRVRATRLGGGGANVKRRRITLRR
jgi:Ca2+-binding RTX toxin-like protein